MPRKLILFDEKYCREKNAEIGRIEIAASGQYARNLSHKSDHGMIHNDLKRQLIITSFDLRREQSATQRLARKIHSSKTNVIS